MALWVIEPVARPEDPIWQDRQQWSRVVVRAPTAALARVVAEPLDRPNYEARPGFQYPGRASGFLNEKIYRVRPCNDNTLEPDGPPAVLLEVKRT